MLKYKNIGELIDKIGLFYDNGSKWELNMSSPSVEASALPEYPKGAFLIDLSVLPGINEARQEYTVNLASIFLGCESKQQQANIPNLHLRHC